MLTSALATQFRGLAAESDPQRRGRTLERLIASAFRLAHFDVKSGAGAARPRQTDLLAQDSRHAYLIETKWRRSRAGTGDVAAVRDRLERTPSAVIGVLVSIAGFAPEAISEVEAHRTRPVLLFDGHEAEEMLRDPQSIRTTLEAKLRALLVDGRASVGTAQQARRRSLAGATDIVAADASFLLDGEHMGYIPCRGGYGDLCFTRALPDIDWLPGGGAGMTLDMTARMHESGDLVRTLTEMSAMGWLTPNGHWTLQQAETNWHGMGAVALLDALRTWSVRYRDAGALHHTEKLCYVDECLDGFYTLVVEIRAMRPRTVWRADVSLQLRGMPLDAEPIRQLARVLSVDELVRFRPRVSPSVTSHWLRTVKKVVPHALIVQDEREGGAEKWVVGLVVKNPFFSPKRYRGELPEWFPEQLMQTQMLICDLASHHLLGDRKQYWIKRSEWAYTSDALVVRLVADW